MDEKVLYEDEVCKYLNLPAIPKKIWNGKASFKKAVVAVVLATDKKAYAIASFDADVDDKPHIVKAFSVIPFSVKDDAVFYVVPEYMDIESIEAWDVDSESKKAAHALAEEARELENEGVVDDTPKIEDLGEWIFPEINNKEEAEAWLRRYNTRNGIRKNKVPSNAETLKLRLYAIYCELNKKSK